MNSRMEKYNNSNSNSRTSKNSSLYRSDNTEVLDSNTSFLKDQEQKIDISEIKAILDKKYRDQLPMTEIKKAESPSTIIEEKQYDINVILDKAREQKEVLYEEERLKKVNNSSLTIIEDLKTDPNILGLVDIIKTGEEKQIDPLEILTDLKEESEKTTDIKEIIKEEVQNQIDKTFYTNSNMFTKSDFDDFNDLKENIESNKAMLKFLIILIIFVIILVFIILINNILKLNWF